ncbi:Rpn_family recombination-promoting nuclease/putative transposase [Hexamita inflata]|uniref:Rpn family recombination-promoting nuclease/putative transposase n=1 Tax=Hexamita inflata TaxID=28002 RepID=A0AA86NBP2_9EUKA|nr:Rpn family recombination-promoting nuclease/putative transposase [Hexamita inflata]
MNSKEQCQIWPTIDIVFQRIMGTPENSDILIHFLNSILHLTLKHSITQVQFFCQDAIYVTANTELQEQLNIAIYMVNEDSEIQMQHDMMKMTKQYASTQLWNDISNNSNENDKIIIINILDFNHFHTQERKREMGLFDDSTNTVLTNKFCIKYFELLKYSYQDLSDNENIWMSFLKKPTIYDKKQEIVFYKVFHILKIIEKDSVFMNAYNNRMNQIQVYRAAIKIQKENVYKEQTLQNQLEEKQKYELKLRKQLKYSEMKMKNSSKVKYELYIVKQIESVYYNVLKPSSIIKYSQRKLQIHVSIIKQCATHLKILKSYMEQTIRNKKYWNAKEIFYRYLNR